MKKLRFMTPISMTLVQVQQSMVKSFFPQLEQDCAFFCRTACSLATDVLTAYGAWYVGGGRFTVAEPDDECP